MNHEYTIYYIFLQCRYTTWWLKSIHSLVFCRKILLHSFLPTCCPGRLSGTSRDCATQCRFSDVSKSWGSRWRFREKGISVMLPGSMLLCGIFLGIWLNIYVIQSLRRKLRRHFQLGKQLFVYTPKACESNLNWEGTLGRFAGALRAPKPVGGFLLLDAPTGLQPRLPVLLLSICDLLDGPAA